MLITVNGKKQFKFELRTCKHVFTVDSGHRAHIVILGATSSSVEFASNLTATSWTYENMLNMLKLDTLSIMNDRPRGEHW